MADLRGGFTTNTFIKYCGADFDEAYQRAWRLISEKMIYLLKRGPQAVVTFEPLYSQIYRTVCAGKSEKLYLDLMALISTHLNEVNENLGDVDDESFDHFVGVSNALRDYIDGAKRMTLLFSYFNKKYVFYELSSDLFLELADLFNRTILERRMPALMVVAEEALQVPYSFTPTIFHHFCADVWTLCNRQYAVKYPRVFSRYHMRVCPDAKPEDAERPEVREYEDRVREHFAARKPAQNLPMIEGGTC